VEGRIYRIWMEMPSEMFKHITYGNVELQRLQIEMPLETSFSILMGIVMAIAFSFDMEMVSKTIFSVCTEMNSERIFSISTEMASEMPFSIEMEIRRCLLHLNRDALGDNFLC
jgi:hypothetical protein